MMDKSENKKTGAVLVQGGGIAGVQASLDLANSGFKVYLVERAAAIGGMMSHLDKTFPTGDCATCIGSPKFVECARNLNIEILTYSELQKIEGEPGHFTATVKKFPRYVDEKICNDCGDCYKVCPVEVKDRFNRDLGTRKAIAKYSPQAVPNIAGILKLGHAPCKIACPANINVQGYIQLIKKREYIKAVNLIRQRNPLSAICGRVCTHPCETVCTRANADSAVAIRQLKRFASDKEMEMIESGELSLPDEKSPLPGARKVAVIGAGPAGLSAANDLALLGHSVTVFESLPQAGGMLTVGIPEYRLPKSVISHDIELIKKIGVNIKTGVTFGKDITLHSLHEEGYNAFFLATGLHVSRRLNIEGEELEGVLKGVDLLRDVSLGNPVSLGKKVVVIGGGNVAIDVALTAVRLGPKDLTLVCLEKRDEMPAFKDEVRQALDEGVKIINSLGPNKFLKKAGKLSGIEFKRCTSVFNDKGFFDPQYDATDLTVIKADTVIVAIGQAPDTGFAKEIGLSLAGNGTITISPTTGATNLDGVFAGGDVVTGPASVIEAVAAGKRAAESINIYLRGGEAQVTRFEDTIRPVPEKLLPSIKDVEKTPRETAKELPVQQRINNFAEIEAGFSEEEALRESERCLNCALCSECGECVEACEKKAIDHNMTEQEILLKVGSVILAPGFQEIQAEVKGEYGFGRYPNVITSVQFERLLSAAGPSEGHVVRRSDGREVRRIAFIQCVGSRDSRCGHEYCSSVCCMATTKQAMVAREHVDGLDVTIFYMDIRAFGKGFDQFYERARSQDGIKYIKSMPSRIIEMPRTKDLRLRFVNEKYAIEEKEFDLVVLSVGMDPKPTVSESISRLGIDLNEFGFCATDRLSPLETSMPGVFVAGAFQEPKDIPETVTQASAAASMSMEMLAQARYTLIEKKAYPDEHDITDEEPRIGVFVCHCGINIAAVIDVERVVEAVLEEPDVIMATHTMFTCSDASLSEIKDNIRKHRLNRIVVASCTPRTHEPLFRETLREAGLNPYLFELANIRDQCSWVHSTQPEAANEKAIELVRMSVARARLLTPLVAESIEINQDGLVIGGGLSGMTAALSLADQGCRVHLVERTGSLGGHLIDIHGTLERGDISDFTSDLIRRVKSHPNILLHLETQVASVAGHVGNFRITLSKSGEDIEVTCGALIVATGAEYAGTAEFLYNESDHVLTQLELEKGLYENTFNGKGKNIVMIQCVGSRNSEREYCSRICCSVAIKNALKIKDQSPDANIFVLYRDIRTYGFRELYYKKAREKGVVFIRYNQETPPVVSDNGGLLVTVASPDFPETIEIEADNVILSTGIHAREDNRQISDMFKIPLNADGFFMEAHLKLRPVDFANEGIFLCGLAHSPKFIDENISQARAAAGRAATVLSKTHLESSAQVSHVDQNRCISCMTCVNACPYGAPFVNHDHKAQIVAAKCMGCGICVSECPAHAIQLNSFESKQFNAMLDTLFQFG
jgi:heterodisulfide reductase subunit A-like polyferredoxin